MSRPPVAVSPIPMGAITPPTYFPAPPQPAPPIMAAPTQPPTVLQTSAMILSWLRTAVPHMLSPSAHAAATAVAASASSPSSSSSSSPDPARALAAVLTDGVVLADLMSYLDPARLSPPNILRAAPRNARSAPPGSRPVDARQRTVQYEANIRRVLYAVRKVIADVRVYAHHHAPPTPPAAVDAYVGNPMRTHPADDIRPVLRLSEVVVACACYGPRHNEFRHAIWRFESHPVRAAFLSSMAAVAAALALPAPDVLYAAGPPPALVSSAPPSPAPSYTPSSVFSPPGRIATPPLRQYHQHNQLPAAPSYLPPAAPFSPSPQNPPLYQHPAVPISPRASLTPQSVRSPVTHIRTPPVASRQYTATRGHPQPSTSIPATAAMHVPPAASAPTSAPAPVRAPAPAPVRAPAPAPVQAPAPAPVPAPVPAPAPAPGQASVPPVGTSSHSAAGASTHQSSSSGISGKTMAAAATAAAAAAAAATAAAVTVKHKKSQKAAKAAAEKPPSPAPQKTQSPEQSTPSRHGSAVTDPGVVSLSRSVAPDTTAAPLVLDSVTQGVTSDDGMGLRKFSMVTDDSNNGSQTHSPTRIDTTNAVVDARAAHEEGSAAKAASGVSQSPNANNDSVEFVRSMRSLEEEHEKQQLKLQSYDRDHEYELSQSRDVDEQQDQEYDDNIDEAPEYDHGHDGEADTHGEHTSKRSSDEFYTPREASPAQTPRTDDGTEEDPNVDEFTAAHTMAPPHSSRNVDAYAENAIQEQDQASSHMRQEPEFQEMSRVDESVRQSVSSSIIDQVTSTANVASGSSTTLGQSHVMPREAATSIDGGSSVYGAESYRSVDFSDPRFAQPAVEAPSPSNHWHPSGQRAMCEGILSPQPLYSPPQMPQRLRRSSAATQMTPPASHPAPPLFRSGSVSSQQSYSSAGGFVPSISGQEDAASKNQRVSFASHITTPGGQQLPLEQPVQESEALPKEVEETNLDENQQSRSLAHPVNPAATYRESEPPVPGDSAEEPVEVRQNVSGTVVEDAEESADGHRYRLEEVHNDRTVREAQDVVEDERNRTVSRDEYAGPPTEDDNNTDSDQDACDRAFEVVEEYVVANSDEQTDDLMLPTGEEEPRYVEEEKLASSGEFDIGNDAEGDTHAEDRDTNVIGERQETERERLEGHLETNEELTEGDASEQLEGEFRKSEETTLIQEGGSVITEVKRDPEVELTESRPNPIDRASEPNIPSRAKPPLRPGRSSVCSTPDLARPYRSREVPPTPPSPPAMETLVMSFSNAAQMSRVPPSSDTRSVSTMEPSADLFQKLISVWQGSDDGHRADLSQSEIVVEGLPAHAVQSDPPASLSTHESTLPSGDIGSSAHVIPASPDASRGRRPRAMRLPGGLKAPQPFSSSYATREEELKSPEEEKASVASFSDAFSYEERDHADEAAAEWEEALKGHRDAGIPMSTTAKHDVAKEKSHYNSDTSPVHAEADPMPPSPSMVQRKSKSHSTSTGRNGIVQPEEHLVKVDRRRLDWLTRQLLAARETISRKDLQMTFAETERMEQREILLLEKQDAESVVGAMKNLLADRENELRDARTRLSVAIDGVSRDRSSQESKTSAGGGGEGLAKFIAEGHTKLHTHIAESETKQVQAKDVSDGEMKQLLSELQHLLGEAMVEMTEKRDAELNALRQDIDRRERMIADLQQSSTELMNENREMQSETSAIRLEKERADHRYKMEMSHVSAQVELVNEFSKKLHDNFRETENLRQQVLHYQDKLSNITSSSGISKRQIKELREAVTRANDECARLRREADVEKRKRMEAIRRAEELEDLRMKDDAAHGQSRYPDRQDSGSFRSHDPVRPAGHNRPGGGGVNSRYHGATRNRGMPSSPRTAQRAWLVIKDKIGGIVTGKDNGTSRRRAPGYSARRDYSTAGSGSQSSQSQTRSRGSPRDDDFMHRSRSASMRSRSSQGSGSSGRSGQPRSNRSGGSGERRGSPREIAEQYMHAQPYGMEEVGRIRATDF